MSRSLLIIADDWEALERYEERLSQVFSCVEAWPMGGEGLNRATEQKFDCIVLDLVLEDLTPREAAERLSVSPPMGSPRMIYVGEPSDLQGILDGPRITKLVRPFDWSRLIEVTANTAD